MNIPIRRLALSAIAILMLEGARCAAAPLAVPPLRSRVNDYAGLLSKPEAAAVERSLAAFEAKTTDQIAVLTTTNLQGLTIEDYANGMFRAWKLGVNGTNNGVLMIIAVGAHNTARIEVGYGLEGALPDAVCSHIIREDMRPAFKAKRYADCINAGLAAIEKAIAGEYKAPAAKAGSAADAKRQEDTKDSFVGWSVIIAIIVVIAILIAVSAYAASKRAVRSSSGDLYSRDSSEDDGAGLAADALAAATARRPRSTRAESPQEEEDEDDTRGRKPPEEEKEEDDAGFSGLGGSSGGGGATGSLD